MPDNLRLVIMTFPQSWEPATRTLGVNAVLVPTVSPLDDPLVGSAPRFADHVPDLRAVVIDSLDTVPTTTDPKATRLVPAVLEPQPAAPTRPNYVELMAHFGRTNRTKFRDQVVRPLILLGLLALTVPDKPNSRFQQYVTTPAGRQ